MTVDAFLAAIEGTPPGLTFRIGTGVVYVPKLPDLIGIKDRKYLDATGLVRHRSSGDLMRYAALIGGRTSGMELHTSFGDWKPFGELPDPKSKVRYTDEHPRRLDLRLGDELQQNIAHRFALDHGHFRQEAVDNAINEWEQFSDESYTGRIIEITGRVDRITRYKKSEKTTGEPEYTLEFIVSGSGQPHLVLIFALDQRKALAALVSGHEVTIRGVCQGQSMSEGKRPHAEVVVKDCRVVVTGKKK